jgi:hypothetical protein
MTNNNLLLIATHTRTHARRVMLAPEAVIDAAARYYWGTYLPTSAAQAAAGNRNAVNTHQIRLLRPSR